MDIVEIQELKFSSVCLFHLITEAIIHITRTNVEYNLGSHDCTLEGLVSTDNIENKLCSVTEVCITCLLLYE